MLKFYPPFSPGHVIYLVHALLSIGRAGEAIVSIRKIVQHLLAAWEKDGLDIGHCPPIKPLFCFGKEPSDLINEIFVGFSKNFCMVQKANA
jgi:hypothetical protein